MITDLDPPVDELVRLRRRFHAAPELSMQEFATNGFIEAELHALPFDEIREKVAGTGTLATLRGRHPGPVTLLRADIDGLPVQELNDVPYASTHAGRMHACGHDAHAAILLATAKALAARRDEIHGTIVFCFQPGEEGSAGNRLMIEAGALENPHVDRTFALHVYTGLDVGFIGVRDGAFFASADEFRLTVRGVGGHGAMPDQAIDPIAAGAQIVSSLQSIVSREIAPKDPVVVTVGRFTSGTTFNVIPDEALLEGTVRCFDAALRQSMPGRLERIIKGLCAAYRVEYAFEYHWQYPPTVNDPAINAVVRHVGRALLGEEQVVEHDIAMWAEDMSFMQEQRPGAYFLVGARGGERSAYSHHSARFDIDERALEVGYRMMTALALLS
jgi:amidohydrolase